MAGVCWLVDDLLDRIERRILGFAKDSTKKTFLSVIMTFSIDNEEHDSRRRLSPHFEAHATAEGRAFGRPITSTGSACSPPPNRRDDHHHAGALSALYHGRLPPRVSPTGFGAGICRSDRYMYLPNGPRSRTLNSREPCLSGHTVAPPCQPQCARNEGSRPRILGKPTYPDYWTGGTDTRAGSGPLRAVRWSPEGPWQARTGLHAPSRTEAESVSGTGCGVSRLKIVKNNT